MTTKLQTLPRHPLRGGKPLVRASAARKRTVRKLWACALLMSLLSDNRHSHVTAEIAAMRASEPR